MKKITLNYMFIIVGMTLIIGSYFITSVYYDYSVLLYFIVSFSIMAVLMIVLPVYFWLFKLTSKLYVIKKGMHYSGFRFKPFYKCNSLEADVTFYSSCRYFDENNNQLTHQINKLFGFGDINHHKNSHRIGWKYNKTFDKIFLYRYVYIDGSVSFDYIDSVNIGEKKRLKISSPKNYIFGKFLFPYFGGKEKAPQDIKIDIYFKK